mgnify:FL=1
MLARPKLVVDDPWLEPHELAIQRRIARFEGELAAIEKEFGSIRDHADAHCRFGVNADSADFSWQVREWAPAAQAVFLSGDFNGWDRGSHPLAIGQCGVWELKLPADALAHGQRVKLHVIGADASRRDRIPACIRRAVQDPETNDYSGELWSPAEYAWKHETVRVQVPLIYEAHVGMAGEEPRVHGYREFAESVLPRVAAAGYNTVQLMAVQEHPYYGSFGYHVSSFFAPCSRFGTPDD